MEKDQKICEHCGQPIPEETILCLYCGEGVEVDSGFLGWMKFSFSGWFIFIISCVAIAAFVAYYVL